MTLSYSPTPVCPLEYAIGTQAGEAYYAWPETLPRSYNIPFLSSCRAMSSSMLPLPLQSRSPLARFSCRPCRVAACSGRPQAQCYWHQAVSATRCEKLGSTACSTAPLRKSTSRPASGATSTTASVPISVCLMLGAESLFLRTHKHAAVSGATGGLCRTER